MIISPYRYKALALSFWISWLTLISSSLSGAEITSIKVVSEEWESFTNSDGTGAYWEVVKAIYEPIGIKVNIETAPWKRAVFVTINKSVDAVVGNYYFPEQDGVGFLYPKWHISVEEPIFAFYKKNTNLDQEQNIIQALSGKRLGWVRGYDYQNTLFSGLDVNYHEVNKVKQGLQMVKLNRLDAFINYESQLIKNAEISGLNYSQEYSMKPITLKFKLFVSFSNTARSKELIRIFDERMTVLNKTNEVQKIYEKWGLGPNKQGLDLYLKQ